MNVNTQRFIISETGNEILGGISFDITPGIFVIPDMFGEPIPGFPTPPPSSGCSSGSRAVV